MNDIEIGCYRRQYYSNQDSPLERASSVESTPWRSRLRNSNTGNLVADYIASGKQWNKNYGDGVTWDQLFGFMKYMNRRLDKFMGYPNLKRIKKRSRQWRGACWRHVTDREDWSVPCWVFSHKSWSLLCRADKAFETACCRRKGWNVFTRREHLDGHISPCSCAGNSDCLK